MHVLFCSHTYHCRRLTLQLDFSFFTSTDVVAPIHEALDTKFFKLDKSMNSKENLKRRFFLRAFFFIANTFVTLAIPFMGDFVNLFGSFSLVPLTFVFLSMIFIKVTLLYCALPFSPHTPPPTKRYCIIIRTK